MSILQQFRRAPPYNFQYTATWLSRPSWTVQVHPLVIDICFIAAMRLGAGSQRGTWKWKWRTMFPLSPVLSSSSVHAGVPPSRERCGMGERALLVRVSRLSVQEPTLPSKPRKWFSPTSVLCPQWVEVGRLPLEEMCFLRHIFSEMMSSITPWALEMFPASRNRNYELV